MQTKWILATVFAAATAVSAEANRPKIYYPRNVKRQIDNNNVTDIAPTPESTTSKRQFLPGLIDDLFGDSTTTEKGTTTTKNSGILLGPTGIVIPGVIGGDDETDTGPSATNTTNTATETQTGPQQTRTQTNADPKPTSTSKEGLLDPLPTLISEIVEPTSKPATTEGGNGNSTNTEDVKPTAKPTTSTGGGLLDPILNPEPEPTTNAPQEPTSTTGGGLLDPILPEPSDNSTKPDPETGSTTTSGGGLLDPLPTLITDILSPTSTANNTDPGATTTSNIISDILPTLLPPESTTSGMISEPIPSLSISIPVPSESTVSPNPTDLPGNNTSLPVPTSSEPTSLPTDPPGNVTEVPTTPLPTLSPTDLPSENSTVPEPTPSVTNTNIHTPAPTTQQPTPTTVISQPPPPTTEVESEKPGVTSIRPTATYTNSQDWMPTTIVADPTSFTYVPPTSQPTGTSSQALPTEIPKVILPDNPNKPAPEGTVAIQIGFLFPLNYEFVAKNTVAAAQIFKYLPQALSTAGGFSEDQVVVTKLVPYDTRGKWGYVTTLAKLYYPEALLDTLQMDLWAPNSKIYNSGNIIAEDLTAVINPKIDIFGNIEEEGPNKGGDEDGDGGSGGDAFDSGDSGNSSSSQKATTAGIAVGAVGLSAMYGAAMFIVARRYKRKRQAHRRASSITGSDASSDMQYAPNGSPALMGGALLSQDYSNYGAAARESQGSGRTGGNGSARTANISAPVATENSLGWN